MTIQASNHVTFIGCLDDDTAWKQQMTGVMGCVSIWLVLGFKASRINGDEDFTQWKYHVVIEWVSSAPENADSETTNTFIRHG